jgi:hypothetical protein
MLPAPEMLVKLSEIYQLKDHWQAGSIENSYVLQQWLLRNNREVLGNS